MKLNPNIEKEVILDNKREQLIDAEFGIMALTGKISELFGENIIDGVSLNRQIYRIEEKLGDALWYLTAIARTAGLNLGEIASANVIKTQMRKKVTEEKNR